MQHGANILSKPPSRSLQRIAPGGWRSCGAEKEEEKDCLALVVSLLVVMFLKFRYDAPQRVLPEQDQL
jgi:hypothetical protein